MSEYVTIADLDGCPGADCPLAEYCHWSRGGGLHPGMTSPPDPMCDSFDGESLIEDILSKTRRAYARIEAREDRELKEERARAAKKAAVQEKRRATLAKNREVNKERARLRAKARLADKMGVTERTIDLMGELMNIRRAIPGLAMAGAGHLDKAMLRAKEISAELEEENKKSTYALAAELAGKMMRGEL